MNDVSNILINEDALISQAVERLHKGHQRIGLITDTDRRLLGVISDSDIRRAILNGQSFKDPVSTIMVRNPVVAHTDMTDDAIMNLMQTTRRFELPVVDNDGVVLGLRTLYEFLERPVIREAVIMAGGLGMRLRPLTETVPKPLLQVGNRPILFIIMDQLIRNGINRVRIAINYKGEMIKEAINSVPHYRQMAEFVEETEPLGTAGALSLLESPPTGPFIVINADLLTQVDFIAMLQAHESAHNDITLSVKEEVQQIPYGVVNMKGSTVTMIEEKPSQTFFINAGIYILNPRVLELIEKGKMLTMTDLVNRAVGTGMQVGSFPVYESWMDIGAHESLHKANQVYSAS